jgi:endonuclease/exonuclease/phosphatase family metal-dependent hydrolase
MRGKRSAALVIAVLIAIAGCSSDDSNDGGGAAPTNAGPVRFVSQNILHGSACEPDTNNCALPQRIELFARQLQDGGCPHLVGLQEVNVRIVEALEKELPGVCDGRYKIVNDGDPGNDREVVLSTLPVLGSRRERLAGPLRTAYWVRVASDVGMIEFVTTHLASGSDDRPCDATNCPPPCQSSDMFGHCQARQVVKLVEDVADPNAVVIIGGDLNAEPDEPTIAAIRDAGYQDTHLLAGNAECNTATGEQCTSGRIDDALTDMRNPASKQSERIDYLWIGGRKGCAVVSPTGLFNGEPAVSGPGGLAFPADHTGVQAAVECETTEAQRNATTPLPTVSTTTLPEGAGDEATKADVTAAFNNVFSGKVTDLELKLDFLEDADLLREHFLKTYEETKDLAAQVVVRIDNLNVVDETHANVVYSLLIDGSAVLDNLPGGAVKADGVWKVSRKTFCDVSTQGADTIPEPCKD